MKILIPRRPGNMLDDLSRRAVSHLDPSPFAPPVASRSARYLRNDIDGPCLSRARRIAPVSGRASSIRTRIITGSVVRQSRRCSFHHDEAAVRPRSQDFTIGRRSRSSRPAHGPGTSRAQVTKRLPSPEHGPTRFQMARAW